MILFFFDPPLTISYYSDGAVYNTIFIRLKRRDFTLFKAADDNPNKMIFAYFISTKTLPTVLKQKQFYKFIVIRLAI